MGLNRHNPRAPHKTQDLSHFKALAAEVGFEPVREWVKLSLIHI